MTDSFDLIVLGGGSAGLSAARHARKLGAERVALVEKDLLGGECPNTACVPTKALLRSAGAIAEIRRAGELGVRVGEAKPDWLAMRERMRGITGFHEGNTPVERRLHDQGISFFPGQGEFVSAGEVRVGEHLLRAPRAILTSGSADTQPPIEGLGEAGYVTHVEALEWDELPRSLAIIGAGAVGVEFAQIFAPLGVQVTLLVSGPLPLSREDGDVSRVLLEQLRHEPNLRVLTGVRVERAEKRGATKVLHLRGAKPSSEPMPSGRGEVFTELEAEEVFVAVGHAPAVEGMGLDSIGVRCGRMGVEVDDELRTSAPGVWAAGDVTGIALYTHVASYQAKIAAHNSLCDLTGAAPKQADYRVIPRATFCRPEVASVGLTENDCRREDVPYRAVMLPFDSIERSVASSETAGLAKIIVEAGSGQILGAHVIGARAGELIHEIVPLMAARVPLAQIAQTIHAFPTFSEIWEAVALQLV